MARRIITMSITFTVFTTRGKRVLAHGLTTDGDLARKLERVRCEFEKEIEPGDCTFTVRCVGALGPLDAEPADFAVGLASSLSQRDADFDIHSFRELWADVVVPWAFKN